MNLGRALLASVAFATLLAVAAPSGAVATEGNTRTTPKQGKIDRELAVQLDAADAARDAADYAFWGLVIGAISAAGLIWTLWETRQTSIRTQRAYIRIEPSVGGVVQPARRICIPITISNYGMTAARNVAVASSAVVRKPDWLWESEAENKLPAGIPQSLALHPGGNVVCKVESDIVLPESAYSAVKFGKAVVFARGIISYEDVFGRKRKTTFQFEFHGQDAGDGSNGVLRFAALGNDFT